MIFDALDRFLFATASTTTTAGLTFAAIGSSYTIAVASGAAFVNGNTVFVSDGTHTLTGVITAGGGTNSLTVTSTAQTAGSGAGPASGSAVTVSGLTLVVDTNGQNSGAVLTASNPTLAIDTKSGGTGKVQTMYAVVRYAAAANASGSNNATFVLQKSNDGISWSDASGDPPSASPAEPGAYDSVVLSTTAQAGVVNIPITSSMEFFRVQTYITGSGSTPTVTILSVDFNIAAL